MASWSAAAWREAHAGHSPISVTALDRATDEPYAMRCYEGHTWERPSQVGAGGRRGCLLMVLAVVLVVALVATLAVRRARDEHACEDAGGVRIYTSEGHRCIPDPESDR